MPSAKSVIANNRTPRILVRATNWIGDSVMSMPAVQRLRELKPQAHIALLCPAKLHDLWRRNPFLTETIPFDTHPDIEDMFDREFDVAIIFPNSFRSARECRRADIPCRVGYPGHWRRLLLTDVVPEPTADRPHYRQVQVAGKTFKVKTFPPTVRHQVHRYLDLIAHVGGNGEFIRPRIWLANEELPHLNKFFRDNGRPVCAIFAGAEYGPAKRWMPERFAEVARRVTEQIHCRWLLLGGPRDTEIAAAIETELAAANLEPDSIVNVTGKTTLMELCALLRFSKLLLTNDTGPMHIAYALGTSVVAIFGSTSPELTGPLGPRDHVIRHPVECSPCFLRECPIDFRCMKGITTDEAVSAVVRLLREEVEPRLRV
jgi:heptosyltransferase-2